MTHRASSIKAGTRVVGLFRAAAKDAPMERRRHLTLVADFGVEGDRKAKAGSARQILLVAAEDLEALGVKPGDVRENVTTRGLDLQALPAGTRLRLGRAVVELTKPCSPCGKLNRVRHGLMRDSRGRRGVLGRVIRGGPVRVGDAVVVRRGSDYVPERS